MIVSFFKFLKKYKYELLLFLFFLSYVVYFTMASFLRYNNFYTGRFDLGNMDQTVWNTLHGRIFQLTNPDGTNIIYRLAYHADFILIFLAPFYLLWQDPRMLLFVQTAVIGMGGVFAFLLAKELFGNKKFALFFGLTYFLYPPLQFANLYDFHAVTFAITFLLATFYFLLKKRYALFLIFLFLSAITKEEIWLVAAIIGIYMFFTTNKKLLSLFVTAISGFLFYYLFTIAIPAVRGSHHFSLVYYSDFGSSPKDILKSIFLTPEKIISILLTPRRLLYLFQLFFPVSFLCFFAPLFLLFTGPDFAINLLSNNTQFYQIYYQYVSVIVPFIFLGTLFGIRFLKKKFAKIPLNYYGYLVLMTTLIAGYIYGPLPLARYPDTDMFTKPLPYAASIDAYLNTIPKQYSVAATNNVGSHLSHRTKIFTIPTGIDEADVLVFLLNDKFAQPSLQAQKHIVASLKHNKKYVQLFHYKDFIVFQKKSDVLAR